MTDHHSLIEQLGRDLRPVTRPPAPGKRVLRWLVLALPCAIAASLLVQRTLTDWTQPGAARAVVQLLLALVLGVLALRNAFSISIAGRHGISWKVLFLIAMLWLGLSISSMPQVTAETQSNDSVRCFTFLLVVSMPMMVLTIVSLRRTRALQPLRSLAMAGAGVACMALSLLAFCHPVHLHPLDFITHLAAVISIVALTIGLGWRWVRIDR